MQDMFGYLIKKLGKVQVGQWGVVVADNSVQWAGKALVRFFASMLYTV